MIEAVKVKTNSDHAQQWKSLVSYLIVLIIIMLSIKMRNKFLSQDPSGCEEAQKVHINKLFAWSPSSIPT